MTDEKELESTRIQAETVGEETMSKHIAKPVAKPASHATTPSSQKPSSPYLRAENEDDDGYDPFSDRPAEPEPLFQSDPWR